MVLIEGVTHCDYVKNVQVVYTCKLICTCKTASWLQLLIKPLTTRAKRRTHFNSGIAGIFLISFHFNSINYKIIASYPSLHSLPTSVEFEQKLFKEKNIINLI